MTSDNLWQYSKSDNALTHVSGLKIHIKNNVGREITDMDYKIQ